MATPQNRSLLTRWTTYAPVVAVVALAVVWGRALPLVVVLVIAVLLGAAVLAAVHHAEVVAHRVGEPFGSLVLAVAVTIIEVALIVTLMSSGGAKSATLARDTVFAAVMITTNGIVGMSLLIGARKFRFSRFHAEGTGAALACIAVIATLCLVLPVFTESEPGPEFTGPQLAFVAVSSLLVYGLFVIMQTVRHRDFFLSVDTNGDTIRAEDDNHTEPPTTRATLVSLGLLLVALVAVVGLAKIESVPLEQAIAAVGLPQSVAGIVIALLVLAPETLAAANAARRERIQTSLNLGYGSAMASIGLTIPTIAVASIWLPSPLLLGLGNTHIVLLFLTLLVSVLTVVPGRATRLQGGVHLILLAAYIFLAVSP